MMQLMEDMSGGREVSDLFLMKISPSYLRASRRGPDWQGPLDL